MSNQTPNPAFPEPGRDAPTVPALVSPNSAASEPRVESVPQPGNYYPGQYPPANGQPPVYGPPPTHATHEHHSSPTWLRALFEVIGAVIIALIFLIIGIGVGHYSGNGGYESPRGYGHYQKYDRTGPGLPQPGNGSGTSGQSGNGNSSDGNTGPGAQQGNGFGPGRGGFGQNDNGTSGQPSDGTQPTQVPQPQASGSSM